MPEKKMLKIQTTALLCGSQQRWPTLLFPRLSSHPELSGLLNIKNPGQRLAPLSPVQERVYTESGELTVLSLRGHGEEHVLA